MKKLSSMKKLSPNYLILILVVIGLAITPYFVGGFMMSVIFLIFLYTILGQSWNIVGGLAHLIMLGTAGLFGMGMYAPALFYPYLPVFITIPLGGIMAICGAIVMLPLLRLRESYFAGGTLIFGVTLMQFYIVFDEITRGTMGITLPLGILPSDYQLYLLMLLLAVFATVFFRIFVKSRYGLALKAIGQDEISSLVCGVNVLKTKILAIFVFAFIVGLSGSIYSFYCIHIEPFTAFDVRWSLIPLMVGVIGGRGTLFGPIIGAAIYGALSFLLTPLINPEASTFLMGCILIAIVIFLPRGIVSVLEKYIRSLRGR